MSIIRLGLLAGLAIMLLPADELRQAELSGAASQTAQRTATFCERNPSTCQAGREMWSLFLKKAEFGMELTARLVREQLARASEPTPRQEVAPAAAPGRPWPGHVAPPHRETRIEPAAAAPTTSGGVRIEPIERRSPAAERAPQWRAPQAPHAARAQL